MARALRIEFPGALYHVTSRGNERKAIYLTDTDRLAFLAVLSEAVERFHLLLHAYVLMGNHYHLLIETLEPNLARAMQAINGKYAKRFNFAQERIGHVFARRYVGILVDRDSYLLELNRYIHLNPVRAGLVKCATDYRWSSASAYAGQQAAPSFLTTAEVLGHFAGTMAEAQDRHRNFLRAGEQTPPNSPLDDVFADTLLGSPDWANRVRARLDASLAGGRRRLDRREVPALSRLRLRPTIDEVIDSVSTAMRVDRQRILQRWKHSEPRSVAIYLANLLSGRTQTDIAEAFGIGKFAVSKAAARLEETMGTDRCLRGVIAKLSAELTDRR